MTISVFINTFNEAKRVRACLESVRWADEIVVVDMHSDDATVAIAREYTDKVFFFDRMGYCEPARKFAAAQTSGDWILNLDADEIVTADLKRELLRIVGQGNHDAVYIPRKNYFWGEEMRHGGCGLLQDRPLRFYKKDAVRFTDTIHAGTHLSSSARAYKIDDPKAHVLHFSYASPAQYWEKNNRYTAIEAKALWDSGKEYTFKAALKDAWSAFWKRYVKKGRGYKDGQWGFIYCFWTALYKINIYAQYLLMKNYKTTDYTLRVEEKYDVIIAQALKEMAQDQEREAQKT